MSRSSRRTHDRRFFYKYTSARVATTVLATRKLRWSSPLLFNDPYDVTQELRVDFTSAELSRAVTEEIATLILAGGPPPVRVHPIARLLLNTLNSQNTSVELRRKAAEGIVTDGPTPGQIDAWAEMMQTWSSIVPMLRILCLSEVNDVTPMWLNYADKYRGVVLQLEAVDEVDSVLLMARPVIYQDSLPAIADRQTWARCIIGTGQQSYTDLFTEYEHVKTTAWAVEREWRLVTLKSAGESGEYSDWGFNPRELSAVYLGPRCSDEDQSVILALLLHGFEHVRAYRARITGPVPRFDFEAV